MDNGCAKCGEVHGCSHSLKEYLGGRKYERKFVPWDECVAELRVRADLCGPFGRVM
jgi:hypothetical protein